MASVKAIVVSITIIKFRLLNDKLFLEIIFKQLRLRLPLLNSFHIVPKTIFELFAESCSAFFAIS